MTRFDYFACHKADISDFFRQVQTKVFKRLQPAVEMHYGFLLCLKAL